MQFSDTRPMGEEVLEFLAQNCLSSYEVVLAYQDIDSLAMLAALGPEQVTKLCEEHDEVYPLRGKHGSIGGKLSLQNAIDSLKGDERALPLSARLDRYRDTCSSSMAALVAGNAIELMFSRPTLRCLMVAYATNIAGLTVANLARDVVLYLEEDCRQLVCTDKSVWLAAQVVAFASSLAASTALLMPLWSPTPLQSYRTFRFYFGLYVFLQFVRFVGLAADLKDNSSDLAVWLVIFIALLLLIYRQHLFMTYVLLCTSVYICATVALQCQREAAAEEASFSECWNGMFPFMITFAMPFMYSFVYLAFRYIANLVQTWREELSVRNMHGATWQAEMVKVQEDKSLTMLRGCAQLITSELARQRDSELGCLYIFDRVLAWLNQYHGRLSLRRVEPKARQPHADIVLLFREATAVSDVYACMYVCLCVYIRIHSRQPHADIVLLFMEATAGSDMYACMHVCMYVCMWNRRRGSLMQT
jgi:hypothetical protein